MPGLAIAAKASLVSRNPVRLAAPATTTTLTPPSPHTLLSLHLNCRQQNRNATTILLFTRERYALLQSAEHVASRLMHYTHLVAGAAAGAVAEEEVGARGGDVGGSSVQLCCRVPAGTAAVTT